LSTTQEAVPAIQGWFTTGAEPRLIGKHCTVCGTYAFPPTISWCPNPACTGEDMETVELSRTGKVWSYTDARYQPPPPYVTTTDPYEPFAIAAVEIDDAKIIVLGQIADGYGISDVHVGSPVELVTETLYEIDGVAHLTWRWKPISSGKGS
jgi:uncharacterized OB-fold protein